jgi:hypothetical protein
LLCAALYSILAVVFEKQLRERKKVFQSEKQYYSQKLDNGI